MIKLAQAFAIATAITIGVTFLIKIYVIDLDIVAALWGALFSFISAASYHNMVGYIVSEEKSALRASFSLVAKLLLFLIAVLYLSQADNGALIGAFMGFLSIIPASFIAAVRG